ncbi:homogentisate phytyltransferase [Leptothoe kymatousa]|uniref:Homogentisate phytyltransferase n=1 Tax=Leptothoe kymatousa TAU-MAC 1615 TaxID=2364775 RepID=A0ABS5Y6S2_9CYAN|nr:homogentisate phytyltransferase [Leptothoe kymatousa]MBT9313034.1 homogentisate phytyltransferase [Leptothoe kymatousa TAU-MAC 1615]
MTKSALSPPSLNLIQSPIPWLYAFWKFSRAHTMVGTSLSLLGVFAMAWALRHPLGLVPGTFDVWQALSCLWITWLACICANLYIVGLNQIEDVAVDRVHKPYLPVASGEFSAAQAKMLVGMAGSAAVLLAVASNSVYLVASILLSLVIGSMYSLPPLQLKRFPVFGSLCKLLVRGVVVNVGIFLHAASQLGLTAQIPPQIWVLTLVIMIFSGAIALLKALWDDASSAGDLDVSYNIRIVWWLLTACYSGLIVTAIFIPAANTSFLMVTHGLALVYFWTLGRQLYPTETGELSYREFYQCVWKLFFLEYLIFPTACLLNPL